MGVPAAVLIGLVLIASLGKPAPFRPVVNVWAEDEKTLIVASAHPIESLHIDDVFEGVDYMADEEPQLRRITLTMLTNRGPLRMEVETIVPNTKGVLRKHRITVRNPAA